MEDEFNGAWTFNLLKYMRKYDKLEKDVARILGYE